MNDDVKGRATNRAVVGVNPTKLTLLETEPKAHTGISWLAKALHLLPELPEVLDTEIAAAVCVDVQVLITNDLYHRMAQFYRGQLRE